MFDFLSQNASPFRRIETKVPIITLLLEEALKSSELFCIQSGSIGLQRASRLEGIIILLSYSLYRIEEYSNSAGLWKIGLINNMGNLIIDQMRNALSLQGYVEFRDFAQNRFQFAKICLGEMLEGDGTFLQMGLTRLILEQPFVDLRFEVDSENNLLISEKYMCQDLGRVLVFTDHIVSAIKRYDKTCNIVVGIIRSKEG
jgi:hypothetical protein